MPLLPDPKVPSAREARALATMLDHARPPMPEERADVTKPRWARNATRKGSFAPEQHRPGTRFAPPIPKGHGPRKRFSAH